MSGDVEEGRRKDLGEAYRLKVGPGLSLALAQINVYFLALSLCLP